MVDGFPVDVEHQGAERLGGARGVAGALVVDRRRAEVRGVAHGEDPDRHVRKAPGDGGERRWVWLRELEVSHHLAGPRRQRAPGVGTWPDAPAASNWLEEVLVVGEALQVGPEMSLVVVGELSECQVAEADGSGHGRGLLLMMPAGRVVDIGLRTFGHGMSGRPSGAR